MSYMPHEQTAKMSKIYLDHNATTPVAQEVCDLMVKHLSSEWGNPSSTYSFGAKLKSDIEASRRMIAEFVNCMSSEVIFTGSATESINTALWSATESAEDGKTVVTTEVEHSATLSFCSNAKRRDVKTIQVGVDSQGNLKRDDLIQAIDAKPSLISLMWVNNETGVIFPIEELSQVCHEHGIPLHVDAVQAAGKIPITFNKLPGITYLSLSAHKINGPKGVGILVARKNAPYLPLISGGHQERGRRGGTENVAGIIGAGKAASLASRDLKKLNDKALQLRKILEEGISRIYPNAMINGKSANRVPNTTSVTFPGIESEALLLMLDKDGICASSGSACLADAEEPSHVIKAMHPDTTQARETVRFSTGLSNTEDEILETLSSLERSVKRLSK